ncbi:EamA family transporter, partial [Clostridium perfringens]
DTVLLGIALAMTPFVSTEQAIFLAPFVSTFLHDTCSSIWMVLYISFKKQLKKTLIAATTKSGRFIVLGALLGGPIGMTGYLLSIKYIGSAYTAIISSLYPAIGALLSYIFLKEKMKPISIIG